MSMKIYNAQLSPYSARVRFAVYAKGLDAEIIDGFSTPELEAELEHLNPMAKVPTLVLDDVVVPESEIICEYMEDLGLGLSLRPDSAADKAGWLAKYLDGSAFAVGNSLTLADCTLVPMLFFYAQIGPMFGSAEPFKNVPTVGKYYDAIQTNPHAMRVIKELEAALREIVKECRNDPIVLDRMIDRIEETARAALEGEKDND